MKQVLLSFLPVQMRTSFLSSSDTKFIKLNAVCTTRERIQFIQKYIFYIFRLECTEKVNQSFGRLDISYTCNLDSYCNWIVGDAGISQAVAIVSIHQMNLRENSRYVAYFLCDICDVGYSKADFGVRI